MKKELETVVIEQTGELSTVKMGWLAKLIVEYANAHPETLAEFEEYSTKGDEDNGHNN